MIKVLLYDSTNAFLSPGGKTTHALKLQKELSLLGIDIQFSRWWDISQDDFDIIHFLSPNYELAKLVKSKGKKNILTLIFDMESSKSKFQKVVSIFKYKIKNILPLSIRKKFYLSGMELYDKIVFMHEYDRKTAMRYTHKIELSKTQIIPHAYEPSDMNISANLDIHNIIKTKKYLVSCANISERKQSILLANYAHEAKVPIVFIGKADKNSSYFQKFKKLIDNRYVYYPGYVSNEWKDCIERNASGFILLSLGESGCIAVYEAAAYKIPILLSNLPWAWGYDSPTDIYFCDYKVKKTAIDQLQKFYENAGPLEKTPFKIYSWENIANEYYSLYTSILNK